MYNILQNIWWYTKLPLLYITNSGLNVWTLNFMNQPIKIHTRSKGIIRADKLIHIPNDCIQNYLLFRLELVVKGFDI